MKKTKNIIVGLIFTGIFSVILGVFIQDSYAQYVSCPTLPTNTGKASATVTIKESGEYKIWTRMRNEDDHNSYYLQIPGINNGCAMVVGDVTSSDAEWVWVDYRNANKSNKILVNFKPGVHTLNLIGREARVGIDKIIITKDQICTPINLGANCEVSTPTITTIPTRTPTQAPSVTAPITPTPTTSPATGNTLTLAPVADTYVFENKPATNYGKGQYLFIDGSPERIAYLKFDLNQPQLVGKTIVSASLRVKVSKGVTAPKYIHLVTDNGWEENSMTYANHPPMSATKLASKTGRLEDNTWWDIPFNSTATLQSNIGKMYSLAIHHESEYRLEIYSKDSSYKPTLTLKYK